MSKDQTHHAECWRDPAHHACAVREVERRHEQCIRLEWTRQRLEREIEILDAKRRTRAPEPTP